VIKRDHIGGFVPGCGAPDEIIQLFVPSRSMVARCGKLDRPDTLGCANDSEVPL